MYLEISDTLARTAGITPQELQLATRNHGMPLEGMRYDVTATQPEDQPRNHHGFTNNMVQTVPVRVETPA